MNLQPPRCCGSEDGDLYYSADSTHSGTATCVAWRCNTCGVITIVGGEYEPA